MKLRELDYVQAARALGVRDSAIIFRHILPNLIHLVVITFVLMFSGLVLSEAILSWLGIGIDGSWGQMIDQARDELAREPVIWWNITAAGIALFGLLLAVNFVGDAVRDVPRPPHASRASMSILEIENLTTEFPTVNGKVPVVDSLNLSIDRGEVVALVGESGCGKSLTALSLLRLVPKPGRITTGTVSLEGRSLLTLSVPEMRHVRGQEISMIFQEPMTSLNPVVTVGAQVIEAIRLHHPVPMGEAQKRTVELFQRVGIPDPSARTRAYPHQLSGGLRQRVMIAMALASNPKLLIADEPTTALDATIQAQIIELLRSLQTSVGLSILLITHDLGVVNELADRVAVMYAGRIVEIGSRSKIFSHPAHPYTQGLLRSIPARAKRGEPLPEIAGMVPSPEDWPTGCRFSNRCGQVFEKCRREVPDATRVTSDHSAWCHAVAGESG